MTILVLGGEGMLGHKMVERLGARFENVLCTLCGGKDEDPIRRIKFITERVAADHLDVMDFVALRNCIATIRPTVVINCVGVIKQRSAASLAVPSITLNALLPHVLAQALRPIGGQLIHFSTDCVFSGARGQYTENDRSDADDLYGRSKFLGEVADPNALTLRTSIIGRELRHFHSLLEWFLAQRGKTIRGFTEHYYSGVTTPYLADRVGDLLSSAKSGSQSLSGLYQVAGSTISKYNLLQLLRDAFDVDVEIVPDGSTRCDRSMVGDSFRSATGFSCPGWEELVADLAADPTPYSEWR